MMPLSQPSWVSITRSVPAAAGRCLRPNSRSTARIARCPSSHGSMLSLSSSVTPPAASTVARTLPTLSTWVKALR